MLMMSTTIMVPDFGNFQKPNAGEVAQLSQGVINPVCFIDISCLGGGFIFSLTWGTDPIRLVNMFQVD